MVTNKIISPYLEYGAFAGVRVNLGDEDFVIAPTDYQNGKRMSWQEAMNNLKEDGLSTFNYRQICLTMAFRKEINEILVGNGGDPLDRYYWTCAEFSVDDSFYYNGYYGILADNYKYVAYSVRPIKNLKNS